MSHADIEARLRDTLSDMYRGTGKWCYVVAVFGDDKSGDVVYSCEDDLMKAPYTCSTSGATIDTEKSVEVVPLTTYELEAKDIEATEAGARNSKRDLSQLQAIHDAAKNLGAACKGMKESAAGAAADLKLVESTGTEFLTDLKLIEARTAYPVKLISPGTGSTAHYPASVLEASADKFKAGTLMFWNHPTIAEEAQRPEGNLDNLAAILTSNARWDANGAKGPGLYAEAKVMADYAQKVEERAPHIGLSIRAGGKGTGRLVEGKPELASIDYVESVDYVTKAGRGGLALAEAARDAGILDSEERGDVDMDAAEIKKLIETEVSQRVAAETAGLRERARRGDATVIAHRALTTIGFTEAQKAYVVDTVLRETIPTKDGAVDADALTVLVNTEAKRLGAVLGGAVRGFNAGTELNADPVKIAEARNKARAEEKETTDEFAGLFQEIGLSESAARKAAEGRAN